jgi:hypothetical protein
MSMQTRHRLTIVEVAQPTARRSAADTTATTRNSSTKRNLPASEGRSVKKRTVGKTILSSAKNTVKPAARLVKSGASAQNKPSRRKPMPRQPRKEQPTVEIAMETLPIEIEIPFCDTDQVEPQSNFTLEQIPAALEPAFAESTVVNDEFLVENVENNVRTEAAFSVPESTNAEMEVLAEFQLTSAAETLPPSATPIQRVLLAKPESIRRTVAFQWNVFLQVLAKGWNWLQLRLKTQQAKKRLRVCESVSLGEKRFIAVVQVDGEQFLVGGSSSSVSTLAHLEQPREFSDVFRRYEQSGMQA